MTDFAKVFSASTPHYELAYVIVWEGFTSSNNSPTLSRRTFVVDAYMADKSRVGMGLFYDLEEACRAATKFSFGVCQLRVCLQPTGGAK